MTMSVNELGELIDRLRDDGQGDCEFDIPSPTGGYYSPSMIDVDDEEGYVYLE